jgi:hypothetical protein
MATLPRPYHLEYWHTEPDPDTLPFRLSPMGVPRPDMDPAVVRQAMAEQKLLRQQQRTASRMSTKARSRSRAHSVASCKSDTGDWEWEYYEDEE